MADTSLFDKSILPEIELPEGYTLRPLSSGDYQRGAVEVLKVLTTVGDFTEELYRERFDYWFKHNDTYYTIVVLNANDKVVGIGTLMIERKLIHQAGLTGHIEDIVIAESEQGKKLGLKIINSLSAISKAVGCYKVTLVCSDHNVEFYKKCGFKKGTNEMVSVSKADGLPLDILLQRVTHEVIC
ncbi:Glucosamine 6-phosphate N-acetyltransferase [Neolecta irregularis DAH-3]|uniref:Glucosamine 6-phosphate N-acetyltransferase n=1 Tax=Neolecta irregularis (strain DAH-3) TaxID=1198029 RepID=A0A1U7LIP6_NEOID|nr:Glucosamine 6-phosphate N-acetyltransferase [Neolecta irregularis DAH-3]|eukprot:OLL22530.1 Glucosamine 6-phosphate N-acetyltransferase [Neolecta irregularis DAH-3]